MDAEEFHVPSGQVSSYGHIAKVSFDLTLDARMVGAALKYLQDDSVPWHRIVGSGGAISERGDGGEGAAYQAERLRNEGVEVVEATGERSRLRVRYFAQHAWSTLFFVSQDP